MTIKDDAEHERALEEVKRLMALDAPVGTPAHWQLVELAAQVEKYEKERWPIPPPDCARCWTGAEVRCKTCKGPTVDLDDEYNGLSGGGDYERFTCIDPRCEDHRRIIYVELPD